MYQVKVLDYPIMLEDEANIRKEWIDVKWKIDKEIKKIYYYVTAYFNQYSFDIGGSGFAIGQCLLPYEAIYNIFFNFLLIAFFS